MSNICETFIQKRIYGYIMTLNIMLKNGIALAQEIHLLNLME